MQGDDQAGVQVSLHERVDLKIAGHLLERHPNIGIGARVATDEVRQKVVVGRGDKSELQRTDLAP